MLDIFGLLQQIEGQDEQIVDEYEGRGEQNAFAEALGWQIAHGQGVERDTYHEESRMIAFPGKNAEDAAYMADIGLEEIRAHNNEMWTWVIEKEY